MNILLAFEPTSDEMLPPEEVNMVLINDSDYDLSFIITAGDPYSSANLLIANNLLKAGEMIDITTLNLNDIEGSACLTLQYIASKTDRPFEIIDPVCISTSIRKQDLCRISNFRESAYFDTPVFEISLVSAGHIVKEIEINPTEILNSISTASHKAKSIPTPAAAAGKEKKPKKGYPADNNPNKLLPTIEIDLHIHELVDSTLGMEPKDMLEMQLQEVRRTMKAHSRRIGQKIVFIHGKGDGVLRQEVRRLLRRQYPSAQIEDASYQLYGGGATLVIIHRSSPH